MSFIFPYYEEQIKPRGFLPENEKKDTSNTNQFYSYFDM